MAASNDPRFQSDLTLNADKALGPPSAKVLASNQYLIKLQATLPVWSDIGAARYREMRWRGETAFPKPTLLPDAQDITVPSRDAGRTIPCRLMLPDGQKRGEQPGLYLHIHGGGWTLMDEKFQDPYLKRIANDTGLAVLSAGYRLAPENPFPAGPNDCYDVAEYLVDHAAQQFGGPLMFVGGESAGGHLSAQVTLHLLGARPAFRLRGAVLNYGSFNLSTPTPARKNFRLPLVIPETTMTAYLDAFTPGMTAEQRADPAVSPFWHPIFGWDEATLEGRGAAGLPPALFSCGTLDPLIDDSVFMATKWQMAGAEAVLKLYRGQPHGFNLFPDEQFPGAEEANATMTAWVKSKMAN